MLIGQMHREFNIGVDKDNSLSYPSFRPEEIDLFINKAIENIVKQRYSGNNLQRQSVEETQKRRDDLRNLTVDYRIAPLAHDPLVNKENGVFVVLPNNYWFALEEEVILSYEDCHGNTITSNASVKPITHDRYNKIKSDPFNMPDKIEIISLPYSNMQNELITDDSSSVTSYYLRYYKKPAEVSLANNINCDLSEHLHREIIDLAVNLAIENIESPRIGTQVNQTLTNE